MVYNYCDVIVRSSSVKTRPPVAPKPVRAKGLQRSQSNTATGDAATTSEQTSSFSEVSQLKFSEELSS